MNIKILHVVNIYFVIPYFFGDQLSYMREKGYKIHIICSPSEKINDSAQKYNFKYLEVPILRKLSLISDIKAIIATCLYIKKNKINIVCGHTPKGALISMIAGYLMRVPKRIYYRHGIVFETSKGLKRAILVNIDRLTSMFATQIVCVSPSVYRKSLEYKLNPKSKQLILSKGTCNGIDINRFDTSSIDNTKKKKLRDSLGLAENNFVIGFTGRLVRDKGIIELVKAYKEVKKENPNFRLLLVGMFEDRDALPSEIVTFIKNDDSIIYTGYIDNNTIEYYYSIMDLFILPSYREGFPTSILEASSMKIPVITTKVTGCVDAILENETGLFVDHNYMNLADLIIKSISDNDLLYRLGQNGRNFVTNNFDQKIIWGEIESLYE